LAVPITAIPEVAAKAMKLAVLLAGDNPDGLRFDVARRVAEAFLDNERVRRSRDALLEKPLEPRFRQPKGDRMSVGLTMKGSRRGGTVITAPIQPPRPPRALEGDEHLAVAIADRSSELQRLDRYERRARSRLRFAIRELDSLSRSSDTR
jgi:hypothetical protein